MHRMSRAGQAVRLFRALQGVGSDDEWNLLPCTPAVGRAGTGGQLGLQMRGAFHTYPKPLHRWLSGRHAIHMLTPDADHET